MENNFFCIAGHTINIRFCDTSINNTELLPSFRTFKSEKNEGQLLFTLTVDDDLRPRKDKQLIRTFDTGNGDTTVYLLSDGGYQYIIKDIYNHSCCLLICNKEFTDCTCALNGDWTMRSFGLNDALMLIYAFSGAHHNTLLIHASCIGYQGKAYPFIAKSGTGKSTHSALWMKHIEGAELLNDDNPIIRIINGTPYIFGSPWSGKTPCYRQVKVPLGALVSIERDLRNHIERLPVVQAFAVMLPACSSMKWDHVLYDRLCTILSTIIGTIPVFVMHCLPDEEAARVCHQTVTTV